MKRRKRPQKQPELQYFHSLQRELQFTLMEMLIVMTIVIMVAGIIGMNISGAIRNARFRSGTDLVLDKLQFSQDLMLILKQDIKVKFIKTDQTFQCLLDLDKEGSSVLKRNMNQNSTLSGISSWSFVDMHDSQRVHEGNFTIEFGGEGTKMSQGKIHLYGVDKTKMHEVILLAGYPKPIGKSMRDAKSTFENSQECSNELFPKEVRQIIEEVRK